MLDDIERRLARLEWAAQFPPEPVHAGRLLIAFCIGIDATLAWQSYGGAAREMIANSSPRLSWWTPKMPSLATCDLQLTQVLSMWQRTVVLSRHKGARCDTQTGVYDCNFSGVRNCTAGCPGCVQR
jgi:hypothetical protein